MTLAILLTFWTAIALIFMGIKIGLLLLVIAVGLWIYASDDRQASVFSVMFLMAIIGVIYTLGQVIGCAP